VKISSQTLSKPERPIGIFDSGLGGLTVVQEIIKQLPSEDMIYFGDLARLPYGTKSRQQIKQFSQENTDFLDRFDIKALVIACNSSASISAEFLKRNSAVPVIEVTQPAACEAIRITRSKRIGVLGTRATIQSGAYARLINRLDKRCLVTSIACPLLVPFVEEGQVSGPALESIIHTYLKPLIQKRVDTIILGCTHYPLLKDAISRCVSSRVQLVDSAKPTVRLLKSELKEVGLQNKSAKRGSLRVFVSDQPEHFQKLGERFLGKRLRFVQRVVSDNRQPITRWKVKV